jgi:hypothetical protein
MPVNWQLFTVNWKLDCRLSLPGALVSPVPAMRNYQAWHTVPLQSQHFGDAGQVHDPTRYKE